MYLVYIVRFGIADFSYPKSFLKGVYHMSSKTQSSNISGKCLFLPLLST